MSRQHLPQSRSIAGNGGVGDWHPLMLVVSQATRPESVERENFLLVAEGGKFEI